MFEIIDIKAREVLDSRGNPTIETEIITGGGYGSAIVPSGASTGKNEALELRDKNQRYGGKGVLNAVRNVNETITPLLIGMDIRKQREIDRIMIEEDGTENKSNLGANSILSISLAAARCAADTLNLPLYQYIGGLNTYVLPVPMMNVINGGEHAGNELDFQEFMIMPVGAKSFSEALRICAEIYHHMKKIIAKKYGKSSTNVGDEGGYAPPMKEISEPLEVIMSTIEELSYKDSVKIALDTASSTFYDEKSKMYNAMGKKMDSGELIDLFADVSSKYPIVSIEDPMAEDDFDGFVEITRKLGKKIQIVGDDIFVTNKNILSTGIKKGACNSLLLKVNQIGSLTEAIDTASMAYRNGYSVVVSHRSGETEDTMIADLAVGISSGQIKTGAPSRSERCAKYNRLLRIEEYMGQSAVYAGKNFRIPF
ncbi:MAG TPA: phosphopyruvate hydratase [Methanofastidiosum sp.]|nr:phosphopyruvate hydratase [Methanofastidiosum sp.]HPA49278.1 phosphopyruvate hydratase [Methanofastidiosum sp.]HQM94574.1 phosphopyruvate hydratase [Methanofastidiosum sp.]HQQ49162.1 phosphopyruvate hydratase [Methanofastidiosum sp.]